MAATVEPPSTSSVAAAYWYTLTSCPKIVVTANATNGHPPHRIHAGTPRPNP